MEKKLSRYLYAKKIFYTPAPIVISGKEFYPANQIWCVDADDEWYVYRPPGGNTLGESLDPQAWPDGNHKGIQLFRDYWRITWVKMSPDAPLFTAVLRAPQVLIKAS